MKVLLIGYGSIGKRHFDILSDFDEVDSIHVVTKQNIDNVKTFKSLKDIEDINVYDYFIIANETSKHYEQLDYVCKYTTNKNILVEKPLFDKEYTLESCDNNVFVAYNLRFHPLLQKLKEILKDEDVYYANVLAGQYLPTWRPDQDYRESYSAKLSQGGGVLRDLSHELDYINWLFGDMTIISSINTKISDLEIESDDIFTALGKTDKGTLINVTMDYISKMPLRKIMIHTKTNTIEVDIITNTIDLFDINGTKRTLVLDTVERDFTYRAMHKSVFDKNNDFLCHLKDGLRIVKQIDKVAFRNKIHYNNKIIYIDSLNHLLNTKYNINLNYLNGGLGYLEIKKENFSRIQFANTLLNAYKEKSSKMISFGSIDYQNNLLPLEERKLKVNEINTNLYGYNIEDPLYTLEIKAFIYKIHSYLTYSSEADSVKLLKLQSYIILSDIDNINILFNDLIDGFTDKLEAFSTNNKDFSYFFHILNFAVSIFSLLKDASNSLMETKGELIDIKNFNNFFTAISKFVQITDFNQAQVINIETKLSNIFINYTFYASYYKNMHKHNQYFESIHKIFGSKLIDVLSTLSHGAYINTDCAYNKILIHENQINTDLLKTEFNFSILYKQLKLKSFQYQDISHLCKTYIENRDSIRKSETITSVLDTLRMLLENSEYFQTFIREITEIFENKDNLRNIKFKSGSILISSYIKMGKHKKAKQILFSMLDEIACKNPSEALSYINFMDSLSILIDNRETVYSLYYTYIFTPLYKGSITASKINILMKMQSKLSKIYNFLVLKEIYSTKLNVPINDLSNQLVLINPYSDMNNYYSPIHIYKKILDLNIPIINLQNSEIYFFNETDDDISHLSFDNDSIIEIPKHWNELFCEWDVSFDEKKVLCNGTNMYQTFFETVARAQKKFSIDWESGISKYYFKLFQRRTDRNAYLYEQILNKFPNKSIKFIVSMYHYTPWSYYYSRFLQNNNPKKESLIQINAAYENYTVDVKNNTFASISALNLTHNKKSRAVCFGSSESFSSWVDTKIDGYKLKYKPTAIDDTLYNDEEWKQKINIAKKEDKTIVCILGKLLYDLCVPYMGGTFQNFKEWAITTNSFVLNNKDIFLIVKPHPHEELYSVSNVVHESFLDWFDKSENIYKMGHCEVGLDKVLPFVDTFLLWNGTSVLEIAQERKHLIVCDDWAKNDYPIGLYQPRNINEYFEAIKNYKDWDRDSEIAIQRAKYAELYKQYLSSREFTVRNVGVVRSSTNVNWNIPYLESNKVIEEMDNPTENWSKIIDKVFEV